MADLFELFFDQKFTTQPVICKYIQFRYLKGEKVIDFSELFLLVYKSWSALWLQWMLPFSCSFLEPLVKKSLFSFFPHFILYPVDKFNRKIKWESKKSLNVK